MKYPPRPLTEDERLRVCAMLSAGMTRTSAAKFAGCRRMDLDAELKSDVDFKARVRRAELQPEMGAIRTLLEAARDPKQWRAAAWALERFYPRRYAASQREVMSRLAMQKFAAQCAREEELRQIARRGEKEEQRLLEDAKCAQGCNESMIGKSQE